LKQKHYVLLSSFALNCNSRLYNLVTGWLRVGFCQGNFNADNCLVGGRTMDYGPFGWMDEYDPGFAKWVGSGEHFAFMNQPGKAVQVDPMKPKLKPPGTERLKLICDDPLSIFAYKTQLAPLQLGAGVANFAVLAASVAPLLEGGEEEVGRGRCCPPRHRHTR
jgi:hypothetical protein